MKLFSCRLESGVHEWSSDTYRDNYAQCYSQLHRHRDAAVSLGGHFICPHRFHNSRLLHWEVTAEGTVCLTEDCLVGKQLLNRSVLLRLGASPVLDISVESFSKEDDDGAAAAVTVWLCFAQEDGCIHTLKCSASSSRYSVLEELVVATEGKLFHLGAAVQSMPNIRIGNTTALSRSPSSSLLSIERNSAAVQSVPAERDVLCASWLSHSQLLLGLSAGDILLVTIEPQGSGRLKEQHLKDVRGSLVQYLWSELMGGNSPSFNFDTIHVASLGPCSGLQTTTGSRAIHQPTATASGLAVAVNRCGEVRAWNTLRRQLVLQSSVYELLSAVDGLEQFYRSGGGAGSSSVGRSIASNRKSVNLDACMLRLSVDETEDCTYVLGALAISAIDESFITGGGGGGGGVGLQSDAVGKKGNLSSWQILIVAWKDTGGGGSSFPGAGDRMRLVTKPISFAQCQHHQLLLDYHSSSSSSVVCSSAELVDLQLSVDSANATATIIGVWRVVASITSSVAHSDPTRVVLESVVSRSVLPLHALRDSSYSLHCSDLDSLEASPAMVLTTRSPFHDRVAARLEDEATIDRMNRPPVRAQHMHTTDKLQVAILQRIFLPRRYSSQAISMAYEGFALELSALKMVVMSAESKTAAVTSPLPMMELQLLQLGGGGGGGGIPAAEKQLPLLVLKVCQQIAQLKTHQSISYTAYQRSINADHHRHHHHRSEDDVYRSTLLKTMQSFLSECDLFSQRLETSYPTCLVRGLAVVAEHGGEEEEEEEKRGSSMMRRMPEEDLVGVMIQRHGAKQAIHTAAPAAAAGAALSKHVGIYPSLFKSSVDDENAAASIIDAVEALISPSLWLQFKEMERLTIDSFQALNGGAGGLGGSSQVDSQRIVSFLRSLTPSLRSSLPQLLDSIRTLGNRPMLLKHITELGFSHALLDVSTHDDDDNDDDSMVTDDHHRPPSLLQSSPSIAAAAAMLTQRVVDLLHSQLHRCQVVLLLLSLLQDLPGGGSFISPSLLYDVTHKHLPQVLHQYHHISALLWFDKLRPTSHSMLQRDVELSSFFPLSLDMRRLQPRGALAAATAVDPQRSVLDNFMCFLQLKSHHLSNRTANAVAADGDGDGDSMLSRLVKEALVALQPSILSSFSKYLFTAGQYTCLIRWSAVMALRYDYTLMTVPVPSSIIPSSVAPVDAMPLLHAAIHLRVATSQRLSEYYELMRCVWYQDRRRAEKKATGGGGGIEEEDLMKLIRMKANELMSAASCLQKLCDSIHDGSHLDQPSMDTAAAAALSSAVVPGDDIAALRDCFRRHLHEERVSVMNRVASAATSATSGGGTSGGLHTSQQQQQHLLLLPLETEGYLLLHDMLEKLLAEGPDEKSLLLAFIKTEYHMHCCSCSSISDSRAPDVAMKLIVQSLFGSKASSLCEILYISFLADIIEVFERSVSLLLPISQQLLSEIICDGAEKLIVFISSILDSSVSVEPSPYQLALGRMLHSSWSIVFEYALMHTNKYDQAFEAIMKLAELDDLMLVDESSSSSATSSSSRRKEASSHSHWQDCLHTLVSHACTHGRLDWLCSIPADQRIQSYGSSDGSNQVVEVSDAVSTTLAMLANTLAVDGSAVNYIECLYVFLLSRRNYRDAARVMYTHACRIERETSGDDLLDRQIGALAAAAQSLEVLPKDQRFMLHTSPVIVSMDREGGSRDAARRKKKASAVDIVDRSLLMHLFYCKHCISLVLADAEVAYNVSPLDLSAAHSSVDRLVALLCGLGRFQQAVSLASLCDDHPDLDTAVWSEKTGAHSVDDAAAVGAEVKMDLVVTALARECVLADSSTAVVDSKAAAAATTTRFMWLFNDQYRRGPGSASIVCPIRNRLDYEQQKTVSATNDDAHYQSNSSLVWHHLGNLLMDLEGARPKHQRNMRLHAVAVRSALAFNSMGNNRKVTFPLSLLNKFGGFSSEPLSKATSGDPSALLLLLLEFDHLEDACQIATRLIKQYDDVLITMIRSNQAASVVTPGLWLSYTVLDKVIIASERMLLLQGSASSSSLKALRMHAGIMKRTLEEHFALLLLNNV